MPPYLTVQDCRIKLESLAVGDLNPFDAVCDKVDPIVQSLADFHQAIVRQEVYTPLLEQVSAPIARIMRGYGWRRAVSSVSLNDPIHIDMGIVGLSLSVNAVDVREVITITAMLATSAEVLGRSFDDVIGRWEPSIGGAYGRILGSFRSENSRSITDYGFKALGEGPSFEFVQTV